MVLIPSVINDPYGMISIFFLLCAMDLMAICQMGIEVARAVSAAGSAQPAVQIDVASAAVSDPPPESPAQMQTPRRPPARPPGAQLLSAGGNKSVCQLGTSGFGA